VVRLYLLKTLRGQGLSRADVNTVFQSLVMSRHAYAVPVWSGFLKQHQISKIDAFLYKAFEFSYTMQKTISRTFLLMQADANTILFNSAHNVKHCLSLQLTSS
jgi:hypothetical protein